MRLKVALFGEAERGEYCSPMIFKDITELAEKLGQPPKESFGIHFAIQSLLYEREVIYFRVQEEGFSFEDYIKGLDCLKNKPQFQHLSALCLPGVGDQEIIHLSTNVCYLYQSLLITSEQDLYDYLTSLHHPPKN